MIRNERIRFKVLRDGADYGFLYALSDPTLRCRSKAEIKLSMQGSFRSRAYDANGRELEVNWLKDEIQPILILDGKESHCGILSPSTVTVVQDETSDSVSLEAYDRAWIVRDAKIEEVLHIPSGTKYTDAIEQRLTASGIRTVVTVESTAVLAEDREDWPIGTSNLKIINDLLKEINYRQLWFNADGVAMIEPKREPKPENTKHILSTRRPEKRDPRAIGVIPMSLKVETKTDIYSSPNVFICSCANPDKSGIWIAKAENANPQSPLSTFRRGRRIVDYEDVNNIASYDALVAYTEQKRNNSLITGDVITCDTWLEPDFGIEDITAIQTDVYDDICVETDWEMQLKPGGRMRHTLERVVYNLDG